MENKIALITKKELCRELKVSIDFISERTSPNWPGLRLPSIRIGRHLRFDPADVRKWLDAHRKGEVAETVSEQIS